MVCNRPVPLVDPSLRPINRYLELLQAPCPHCGRTVNRARARILPDGEGQGVGP